MRTLVMGDIHGAYKALKQCLVRAGFDYINDTLIQLGDIADGHAEVFQCVEELLKIKKLIAIKGNHDVWLTEFIDTDFHPAFWRHGGKASILSYLECKEGKRICIPSGSGYKTSLDAADIPASHRQFFKSQKLYHVTDEDNCFVHAGFDRHVDFNTQRESIYYWDRSLWTEAVDSSKKGGAVSGFYLATPFKKIFIGHTPTTKMGTDKPMTVFNIVNVDTGAGSPVGRLTIMDINTGEFWQSDPVGVLYEQDQSACEEITPLARL